MGVPVVCRLLLRYPSGSTHYQKLQPNLDQDPAVTQRKSVETTCQLFLI